MVGTKIVEPVIDFSDYLKDNMSDKLHVAYVNVLINNVLSSILRVDSSAVFFEAADVYDGLTVFSSEKMRDFVKKYDGTKLPSDYAHVIVSHFPQDVVDVMADEVLDKTVLEKVIIDD